jgi:hypothetical protein
MRAFCQGFPCACRGNRHNGGPAMVVPMGYLEDCCREPPTGSAHVAASESPAWTWPDWTWPEQPQRLLEAKSALGRLRKLSLALNVSSVWRIL